MVTTRNLIITGIALITVIALSSAVVLQQIALQRMSRQTTYITGTVTQQPTGQQASIAVGTPYVLVTYSGVASNALNALPSGYDCTASSGNTFLTVKISVENYGYDHVYIDQPEFYVVINSQEYPPRGSVFSCIGGLLPEVDLLNGLSDTGWLLYEVPANYGTFSLVWTHSTQSDVNVQYVHQ